MECEEVLPFTCRVPWVFSWGKLPIKSWSLQRRHRKSMHVRDWKIGTGKKKQHPHAPWDWNILPTYLAQIDGKCSGTYSSPMEHLRKNEAPTNSPTNSIHPPKFNMEPKKMMVSKFGISLSPGVKLQGCQLSLIQPLMQLLNLFVWNTPATISSIETISRNVFPLFRGAMVFHCWKDLFENGFVFGDTIKVPIYLDMISGMTWYCPKKMFMLKKQS